MAVRWRGRRNLVEQEDSPEFDFSGDVTTAVLRFLGPYGLCLASRPQRGSEVSGYDGFTVDKSGVKRMPGGRGMLTINATAAPESQDIIDAPQNKFEITWVQMERPLIQHPIYYYSGGLSWNGADVFPNRPNGAKGLNAEDLMALAFWEKCPDMAIKNTAKYYTDNQKRTPAAGVALSANAKHYAIKRLAGIETFPIYYPVLRMTTLQVAEPDQGPCGQIWTAEQVGDLGFDSLPTTDSGADFMYQATADGRTRTGKSGKWERTREWTGAEYWDEDLYKVKT